MFRITRETPAIAAKGRGSRNSSLPPYCLSGIKYFDCHFCSQWMEAKITGTSLHTSAKGQNISKGKKERKVYRCPPIRELFVMMFSPREGGALQDNSLNRVRPHRELGCAIRSHGQRVVSEGPARRCPDPPTGTAAPADPNAHNILLALLKCQPCSDLRIGPLTPSGKEKGLFCPELDTGGIAHSIGRRPIHRQTTKNQLNYCYVLKNLHEVTFVLKQFCQNQPFF